MDQRTHHYNGNCKLGFKEIVPKIVSYRPMNVISWTFEDWRRPQQLIDLKGLYNPLILIFYFFKNVNIIGIKL